MITTLVTTILIALNVDALTIEQVTIILGGVGSVVAYILAEGYADAHRENDYDV
jgi:positive regulator of sigma E activity